MGLGAALASIACDASGAVVVTVTSGPNQGVVFDSGGFENQNSTPVALGTPIAGTYSTTLTNGSTATVVTLPAGTNNPQGPYSGANYLALTRSATGAAVLNSNFTRSINLAEESFTLTQVLWGTTNLTAFGIGNNITGVTTSTAGVLSAWRYNESSVTTGSHFGQFRNTTQAVATDTLPNLTYNVNGWNTLVYTWDSGSQQASMTLNGETTTLLPRFASGRVGRASQPAPTTVNRFFTSPGAGNTTIWVDAIPEPSSLALIGIGAAAMLRRRRRA
jgi:hypothetical protein